MKRIHYVPASLSVLLAIGSGCPGSARRESPEDIVHEISTQQLVTDATWILRRAVSPDREAPIEIPREMWVGSILRLEP